MSHLSLGLIFGGRSPEHEVSLISAKNIFAALDPGKYQVTPIFVDYEGRWFRVSAEALAAGTPGQDATEANRLLLWPGEGTGAIRKVSGEVLGLEAIFPIIHGPNGEDGSLQGLLRQIRLPFVGPDVLGSSACMDKDVTKRLLRDAGLLVADFLTFYKKEKDAIDFHSVVNTLGSPVFVKPANMGSSVGVKKATNAAEFQEAIADAFRFDHKLLVESLIVGRELECAVMGNEIAEASGIGEVKMGPGFYDYESKYLSADAAQVLIPAPGLDEEILLKLRMVASQAYQVLGCEGMSRVDMFLTEAGEVFINEINTLPGFTSISMYPKLWMQEGMAYAELLDHLILLAQQRFDRNNELAATRK